MQTHAFVIVVGAVCIAASIAVLVFRGPYSASITRRLNGLFGRNALTRDAGPGSLIPAGVFGIVFGIVVILLGVYAPALH